VWYARGMSATNGTPDFLEIKHLTKTFHDLAALDDLSLQVARGSIHGVLGEEGAGKSTLLRMLSGTYPVGSYTGEILLEGRALSLHGPADAIHERIGVVQRKPSVFDRLSIAENISIVRWQTQHQILINQQAMRRETQALLERWEIDLDAGAPAGRLSTGQQRLVMIARALFINPRLIVLDEPLFGIAEAAAASRVLYMVRRLAAEGITCVYLARRPSDATQIADRVTVLRDGKAIRTWERADFDEGAMAQVMPSQRPGDIEHIDMDEQPSGGTFGTLQSLFNRWMRPGS
jgi:putative multiple sugar transport system ATP-binding protein